MINKISIPIVLCLMSLCSLHLMHCHIMTYIAFKPYIILLGDHHNIYAQEKDKAHLELILRQLYEKKQQCFVLVEDVFFSINRSLKSTDPAYYKHTFLPGLIQRIQELKNPFISTLCIERGNILARALFFFFDVPICPLFEDVSPKKLERLKIQNAYSLSYSMLIDEIKLHQKELLARHKQFKSTEKTHIFINAMYHRIAKQLGLLDTLMNQHSISASESILKSALRLWINQKRALQEDQIEQINSLESMFANFIQDYQNGMNNEEWKQQKDMIKQLCCSIEKEHNAAIMKKYVKPEKANCCQNLFQYLTHVPWQRYLCGTQTQPSVRKYNQRELTDIPQKRAELIPDASSQFYKVLLHLRLLLVDSHTTLDIIQNSQRQVVVFAGNMHIQNIQQYLAKLDFERIPYADKLSENVSDYLAESSLNI